MSWEQYTFWINSVFLNSPLVRTIFPFSSSSVQRSLGWAAALADICLPKLNIDSPPSSRRCCGLGRSSGCKGFPLFIDRYPHSWYHFLPFVELWCTPETPFHSFLLCLLIPRGIRDSGRRAEIADWGKRKSRAGNPASRVACRGTVVDIVLEAPMEALLPAGAGVCTCVLRGAAWSNVNPGRGFGLKKQTLSDWDFRNLRSVDEGAWTFGVARITVEAMIDRSDGPLICGRFWMKVGTFSRSKKLGHFPALNITWQGEIKWRESIHFAWECGIIGYYTRFYMCRFVISLNVCDLQIVWKNWSFSSSSSSTASSLKLDNALPNFRASGSDNTPKPILRMWLIAACLLPPTLWKAHTSVSMSSFSISPAQRSRWIARMSPSMIAVRSPAIPT